MVRKNKSGFRIANPRTGIDKSQLTRPIPTLDGISKANRKRIDLFSEKYAGFLDNVRIAPEVVSQVREIFEQKGGIEDKFVTNDDETAFAIVRPGKRPISEGVRIIYSHTDSCCLKVKPNPARLNWDPDQQLLHTGVELDTIAYGGPLPHQWSGRSLEVRGWAIINGEKKEIRFPVYSSETSQHTDTRLEEEVEFLEAHLHESLDLVTGCKNVGELLSLLCLKGEEDFARARLFAVPEVKTKILSNGFVSGYGHDDRSCVYASVRSLLDSKAIPRYTTMIFGFDKEEVGSAGSGGANGRFFETVFHDILLDSGEIDGLENITEAYKLQIAVNSFAIAADTNPAATDKDAEDDRVDIWNIPKLGYGPFFNSSDGLFEGDQVSPMLIDRGMTILGSHDVVFQLTGSALVADKVNDAPSMGSFFMDRGYPTLNIGVPTGSCHSIEELIHSGDLYHTYRAYKAIIAGPKKHS